MEPFKSNSNYLSIDCWKQHGVSAGFTQKPENLGMHVNDLLERVMENRQEAAKQNGFPMGKWVGTKQTHRDQILKVDAGHCGRGSYSYADAIEDTDGIYTDEKGILLTLYFADCVPVFFLHSEKKLIGLVHAGWKGTALGIAGKMIATWQQEERVEPSDVQVVIGPSICGECYLVNDLVVRQIKQLLGEDAEKVYRTVSSGQYRLDLKLANFYTLRLAGVPAENVLLTSHCTSCEPKLFFSHRRDAGQTGRMMAYAGLI